jgi:WD40 repeat protein
MRSSFRRHAVLAAALLGLAPAHGPGAGPPPADVGRLVRQLGSDDFQEREEASRRLGRLGAPALGGLWEAADSANPEVRRRAARLVRAIQARVFTQERVLTGHTRGVVSAALSPDGRLAASGGDDGTARLWDLARGKELWRVEVGPAWAVAFSPDGKHLLVGAGRHMRLYGVGAGRLVRDFRGHGSAVRGVAFSPDGRRLLSGCYDNLVRVWDAGTGRELSRLKGHTDCVMCVAFSPDGKYALSGGLTADRTVRLWDLGGRKEARRFVGHAERVMAVAFAPDGKTLASAGWDGTVRLWDAVTGKEVRALRGHRGQVHAVAFSPDGRLLASGGCDGTVLLWHAARGKALHAFTGHTDEVREVHFSADGRRLLSCGTDRTVRLWRLR